MISQFGEISPTPPQTRPEEFVNHLQNMEKYNWIIIHPQGFLLFKTSHVWIYTNMYTVYKYIQIYNYACTLHKLCCGHLHEFLYQIINNLRMSLNSHGQMVKWEDVYRMGKGGGRKS